MADKERLIDAKLLTTNIAQIAKNCARSDAQKALIGRILFMIEHMPTIEAEPDNGWISVKDRLPESDKIVLIYVCGHRETAYYDNLKRAFILTKDENLYFGMCVVTHWRHLPESPKGE